MSLKITEIERKGSIKRAGSSLQGSLESWDGGRESKSLNVSSSAENGEGKKEEEEVTDNKSSFTELVIHSSI